MDFIQASSAMTTPQQFTLDIEKWVQGTERKLQAFCVLFIQNLNNRIVYNTPVVDGFLRGSWWSKIGGMPPAATGPADKAGMGVIARLNLVASQLKMGETYYAANGAVYAARVEYGFVGTDKLGRKYNQKPRAFVRGTLAQAESIARETIAEMEALK